MGGVNANHKAAWNAKTKLRTTLNCSRIAKEISMMSGIFDDGEKLRRKLVDHCQKQCETGRSQAANLETQKQTKWMEMHQSQVNICFLRGPLR